MMTKWCDPTDNTAFDPRQPDVYVEHYNCTLFKVMPKIGEILKNEGPP